MRNLLIAFLLAIFTIQGAVVAVGEDLVAALKAEQRAVSTAINAVDAVADEADGSGMLEELSDYLPPDLSIPLPDYPVPARPLPHVTFLSIDLPTIEPPPRA